MSLRPDLTVAAMIGVLAVVIAIAVVDARKSYLAERRRQRAERAGAASASPLELDADEDPPETADWARVRMRPLGRS